MLGITYKTWKDTCQMYFDLGKGAKAAYLQWFPFTKISSNDQDTLSSNPKAQNIGAICYIVQDQP